MARDPGGAGKPRRPKPVRPDDRPKRISPTRPPVRPDDREVRPSIGRPLREPLSAAERGRAARKVVDEIVAGRADPRAAGRRLNALGLTDHEKQLVGRYSAQRSRSRNFRDAEDIFGFIVGPDLVKLFPGGTPAGEASPGWAAFEAATLAPGTLIGRPLRYGGRAAARTFRVGEAEVRIPAAGSHVGRGAERLLDKNRKWIPGARSEAEKAGFELERTAKNRAKVETATATALKRVARRLKPDEQYVLRVLAEGVPTTERVALHTEQGRGAEKVSQRLFHGLHIDLLRKASRWVDESSGVPTLREDAPKRLREAWRLLQTSSEKREEIYRGLGLLTDEQMLARVNAPGRVFRGARYVETPARKGRVEQVREYVKPATTVSRPRTKAEAVERLAQLEDEQAQAIDRLADSMGHPELLREQVRGEQARRNILNAAIRRSQEGVNRAGKTSGAVGRHRGRHLQPTVKDEARRAAEQVLDAILAKRPSHPVARAWRAREAEIAELREALGVMPGEAVDVAKLGTVDELVPGQVRRRAFKAVEAQAATKGLVGAEDFAAGRIYTPYLRGVPGLRFKAIGSYARAVKQLSGGGGRRAIGSGPQDQALSKAFTGQSILSGFFRTDVTNVSADSLVKAARLSAFKHMRDVLLRAATDAPRALDDIAIREDALLGKGVPSELRELWSMLDAVQAGELGRLSPRMLDGFELNALESLREAVFPRLAPTDQAVQGIKWVSSDFLESTGMLDVPAAARMAMKSWRKIARLGAAATGGLADATNDILRAAVLYLNPAYAPVQFLQNGILLLMSEGPLALARLPRAFTLGRTMLVEDVAKVDSLMQIDSLINLRETRLITQRITRPMAVFNTILSDLGPRRAAFLSVASKRGYDAKRLGELLNDPAKFDDLDMIVREANDAVGDFERLSDFERRYVSRVIWFWPWQHVAFRYTTRFPLEHPVQASLYAFGYARLRDRREDDLGAGPYYTQFLQKVGERDGLPRVGSLEPLTPFTTPYRTVQAGAAFALGGDRDLPNLAGQLTPAFGLGGEALFGVDSFTRRPIEPGIPGLVKSLPDRAPVVGRVEGLLKSDDELAAENRGRLRPRTREERIAQLFLGPLAPSGYDPRVAASIVVGESKSSKDGPDEWMVRVARSLGRPVSQLPAQLRRAREAQLMVQERQADLKRELRLKKAPTVRQRAAIKLDVLLGTQPAFQPFERTLRAQIQTPRGATALEPWLEDKLGYGIVREWSRKAGEDEKLRDLAKVKVAR